MKLELRYYETGTVFLGLHKPGRDIAKEHIVIPSYFTVLIPGTVVK